MGIKFSPRAVKVNVPSSVARGGRGVARFSAAASKVGASGRFGENTLRNVQDGINSARRIVGQVRSISNSIRSIGRR